MAKSAKSEHRFYKDSPGWRETKRKRRARRDKKIRKAQMKKRD